MTPGQRRTWWLLGAVAALGLLAGAGYRGWLAAQWRTAVLAVVPPRPNLERCTPELRERLDAAEDQTRSLWHPVAGLAELARLYHANGYLAEAGVCEENLIELDPRNPLWPYLRAHTLGGYGDLEKAMPLLQRTIELAPDYVPARIRTADILLKRNEPTRSAAICREVLRQDPHQGYALIGLARCELALGRPDEARRLLQQLVAGEPSFAPGWTLLISIDEQLGDAASAASHRMQSRDTGRSREMPDPWVDELMVDCFDPYRLAVAASAADPANNQARARQLLERAIMIAPNDDLPLRLLGNLLSDLGELASARIYLERAAIINPKEPDNWSYLVRLLKALGDQAAAAHALEAGLSHCPNAPILHLERGRKFSAAGQLDAAAAEFDRARELWPEEPSAYVELALVDFKQDRMADGIAKLRKVMKLDPNHPIAVVLLARYAINTGDQVEARTLIRRAREHGQVPVNDVDAITAEFQAAFGEVP